jgi:hypothetical protein
MLFRKQSNLSSQKIKYKPEIHSIIYESLYEDNDMKKLFKSFLETEKNTAPFEFYLKSKEILNTEKKEIFEKEFNNIAEEYIFKETSNQINLPGCYNVEVTKVYENFDLEETKSILKKINSLLYQELYMDSVNSFI